MKINCLIDNIKEAVLICEKTTGKNLNLPILSSIFLEAKNKTIKLRATNLETGVEIKIPAKIEKEGQITIPAGVLAGLLSNLDKKEQITIETQNNNLLISTKNNSAVIKTQPADDFPTLPDINSENTVSLNIDDFINGLKSVWYSCSNSTIKPELSSVFIKSNKGTSLTFAATDSFRLAERKYSYFFPDFGPILLPIKSISEILRVFDGKNGVLKIKINKNQINLELDNIIFISRLTDGLFPDYQQIIPKKFTTDAVVDKNTFLNSLKINAIFSGKLNELNFTINQQDKIMVLKSTNNEIGEHISTIPVKITGEDIKITFNHKYVYDCLLNIDSEQLILRFSGSGKPLLITGLNNNNFQYLVMPMSV